jgi:hypothetical protein
VRALKFMSFKNLMLCASVFVCAMLSSAQATPVAPIRFLAGMEPDKYSARVIDINPGSVAEFYGSALFNFPAENKVNLDSVGLWGIDKLPLIEGGDLYLYIAWNQATADYAVIASQSTFQGGVTLPTGYSIARKLPWGVVYRSAWGGIPNFHLAHWPSPEIRFTDSEYSALWTALSAGTSAVWTDVDLSAWLPDTARMAYIQVETRYIRGGPAGSTYVRSYGGQPTGIIVGSVNPGSEFSNGGAFHIRVDSTRKLQYLANPGTMLFIRVLGYSMTEPS